MLQNSSVSLLYYTMSNWKATFSTKKELELEWGDRRQCYLLIILYDALFKSFGSGLLMQCFYCTALATNERLVIINIIITIITLQSLFLQKQSRLHYFNLNIHAYNICTYLEVYCSILFYACF